MNFVLLSPNFPKRIYKFGESIKKMGAAVLGIGDERETQLSIEQRSALTEYYQVDSLNNFRQVSNGMEYFSNRYGKIDKIDSFNEYWLELEAKLRKDHHIQGLDIDTINRLQKKMEMKPVFKKAGISFAKGEIYTNHLQLERIKNEYRFPIILKPNKGVGAEKTVKISNYESLEKTINSKTPGEFIVEEFVEGQLETFDGLTDLNGKVVFYTSHIFNLGIMEIVNKDLDIFYYSRREIPDDIYQAGLNVLNILNLKGIFFHIEFIRTIKNYLFALEINLRPPGGLTLEMFNYANNMDIYQQWANVTINNQFNENIQYPYYAVYFGRKNNYQYENQHANVISLLGSHLVCHEPIDPVFRSALGDYGYIFRVKDIDTVLNLKEKVLARMERSEK